ncbi:hypothetical protein, partial [Nostoc sp. FACHB-190]|uniref:hypothetical protein n=1 Tax=Nostoc sp. FACHB-190 TaxID=2692838 RepID=UPI001684EAC5
MHINLRNLEAINELPHENEKVMLNQNQLRSLEASYRWLRELQDSAEFKQLEYYPDVTLGDAIQAIGELLDEHEPCDYNRANFTDEQLYSCLERLPVMHIRRVKSWREKIALFILDTASEVALVSLLTTCSELQTSRAKTANKAILKPHYLQIRFCSKRHYLQMKL